MLEWPVCDCKVLKASGAWDRIAGIKETVLPRQTLLHELGLPERGIVLFVVDLALKYFFLWYRANFDHAVNSPRVISIYKVVVNVGTAWTTLLVTIITTPFFFQLNLTENLHQPCALGQSRTGTFGICQNPKGLATTGGWDKCDLHSLASWSEYEGQLN